MLDAVLAKLDHANAHALGAGTGRRPAEGSDAPVAGGPAAPTDQVVGFRLVAVWETD